MTALPVRDVLVGLAAFLLVGGGLMHVVVAERFATTWPVADVVTTSRSTESTVFDLRTLETRTGVVLNRRRTVIPAVAAVPGADAYVVSTTTTDDGRTVSRQRWVAAQETVTGSGIDSSANAERVATLDSSGDAVEGQRHLPGVGGVVTRFPRGTRAHSYDRFDPETRRTGEATFVRRTRVAGHEVLEFRQVEAARAGSGGDAPGAWVSSDTTLWVRPEVGAVVKTSTRVVETDAEGVTTLDARFVDDAASVVRSSAVVDRVVARHRLRGSIVPGVAVVLGAMLALAAVVEGRTGWLARRMRRRRPQDAR